MSSVLKIFSFTTGEEIFSATRSFSIGRVSGNDFVIPEESISRNHAEIILAGDDWIIRDLGSTNGSMLNGEHLQPGRMSIIRNDDRISLGSYIIQLKEESIMRNIPSLIIFQEDQYEGSFGIGRGTSFSYGGPQATIDCKDGSDLVFFIQQENSEVMLMPRDVAGNFLLNGEVVKTKTPLEDRDELKLFEHVILFSLPSKSNESQKNSEDSEKNVEMPDYLKSRMGADNWNDPFEEKRKSTQGKLMIDEVAYEDSTRNKTSSRITVSELGAQRFSTPSLEAVKFQEKEQNNKYALFGVITLVILIGMVSVLFNLYLNVIF